MFVRDTCASFIIINYYKEKRKIFKGKVGRRVNWKKAVVKVSEGQMIDVNAS